MPFRTLAILLIAALAITACGSKKPQLYPNTKLQSVGQQQAQADIDECSQLAERYAGKESEAGDTAKRTAVGAGVGAAGGAAGGAIFGSPGRGAAAGAAAGAVGGLFSGMFDRGPDPVYRNYVDRCLREKGYEPMGWK
ncbi:glycine zipper family protein [Desulfocurvibacter africanus]|uniref:glycine zipper family protein n=1 Tax=Desulfocurvibacter africanus TaxID=873 RepID=UPI00040EBBFF|nr:glycine zipper family protein [Desulfocurvibacter africanus]